VPCEHTFVSPSAADAFLDRLLDLVPIYYEAGRALAALPRDGDQPSGADLAAAACRRWLLKTIPAHAKTMRPVVAELAAADSPWQLIAFARDVAAVADSLGDGPLAATARHAEAAARAAAAGQSADAGRSAADCLYSSRGEGTDYLVAEARSVIGIAD
jgi:hypothetical protein